MHGIDAVVHLAAAVGVGQSMYQIAHYVAINDLGTAVLLQALLKQPVQRLVVASSMSVYGEGLAARRDGSTVEPKERGLAQLKRAAGSPRTRTASHLCPLATPETKHPSLSSVYALNKFTQERLCLIFGRAYGVPTTALRFFNVYGTRQALSNPYTGVLAIFASRLLNGRPPLIFEDGQQRRDFVHVRDVARACLAALERPGGRRPGYQRRQRRGPHGRGCGAGARRAPSAGRIFSRRSPAATGPATSATASPTSAGLAAARLRAGGGLRSGLAELAEWLAGEVAIDRVDEATAELARRGLVA